MKHLFVLDAYNLIYRNFFAVPPMHRKDGQPTNAVFGMARMILQLLREDKPDVMIIAYDAPSETFRSQKYGEYKGTRDRMPDELKSQLPLIEELFATFGIQTYMIDGYEADDIMGATAYQYASPEWRVSIFSGDKDLYQCLNDNVRIVDGMKRIVAGEKECIEKFGIGPQYVADYLAIVGDSSDNIPGIKGFGPKKAIDLITRFGHLSDIYAHIDELPEKVQATMIAERDMAFLSLELTNIEKEIKIPDFRETHLYGVSSVLERRELSDFFRRQEFHSLLRQLPLSTLVHEENAGGNHKDTQKESLKIPVVQIVSELSEIPLVDSYISSIDSGRTIDVFVSSTQALYRYTTQISYPCEILDWITAHPARLFGTDLKHFFRECAIKKDDVQMMSEVQMIFA